MVEYRFNTVSKTANYNPSTSNLYAKKSMIVLSETRDYMNYDVLICDLKHFNNYLAIIYYNYILGSSF